MSFGYSHRFGIDAAGRPLGFSPAALMAAAARAYRTRDHAEAERCCLAVLEQVPAHFDALHLQGVLCLDRARLAEALGLLTRAAALRPDDAQVHYHLGTTLLGLKRWGEAEAALRRALDLRPDHASALVNLGNALAGSLQHAAAIDCHRRVLAADPGNVTAHFNLGRSLLALERLDDSVTSFRAALAHAPPDLDSDRFADIYANLGQALVALGRHEDAIEACHRGAQYRPQVAAWNESLVLLLLGRFDEGWRNYEGRWGIADHDAPRPDARVPQLAEVAGKRVLLIPEQGHGDMIQFARYAPLLAASGAQVTLQTYPELRALMATLDGVDVMVRGEPEPPADIVTPLLSLPLAFATRVDSIPAAVPYLRPPADRLDAWRRRLGPRARPRIGLAWWGSQHIPKRSLPPDALAPLLAMPGIEWHALQKDLPPAQLLPVPLADHRAVLRDFADTAALIAALDLVISIDTSVAHLAGAMGRPVWIMLPHSADWRWLLDRDDSPWYPTARLFRQARPGDWESVVAAVARALESFAFA
ncbi:MAG: tetratricopeptide repeat-containing glycosyltransferase family protein [Acetobacteraceae bacterium]